MEQSELRAFLLLADLLHFGKTATQLSLSPSTLTRIIQKLEDEVGQPLFIRDKRSVALSDAGALFVIYAEQNLSHWESYKQKVSVSTTELSGELSIYCSVTAVYSVLAQILRPFQSRYPLVKIKLTTGDVADAVTKVQDKSVHISIAARPDNLPYSLSFMSLVITPLELIVPRNRSKLPSIDGESVDKEALDWNRMPVIISERGLSRDRFLQWCKKGKITPQIYAQVAGNEAIIAMVSLGFGIGVVPRLVLTKSPMRDTLTTVAMNPTLKPYDVGLALLEKSKEDPLVKAFVSVAQEIMAD